MHVERPNRSNQLPCAVIVVAWHKLSRMYFLGADQKSIMSVELQRYHSQSLKPGFLVQSAL